MNKTVISTLAAVITVSAAAAPAAASSFQFGTQGIHFTTDTTVQFTFNRSIGAYQSTLGIYDDNRTLVQRLFSETKPYDTAPAPGVPVGSFGNAVTSPDGNITQTFTFLANRTYALGLDSTPNGTIFSTSAWNPNRAQQVVFLPGAQPALPNPLTTPFPTGADTNQFPNPANFASVSHPFQVFTVGFDDRGNGLDRDFQDFVVTAQAVPEPFTVAGTAIAAAGFAIARKRKQQAEIKA